MSNKHPFSGGDVPVKSEEVHGSAAYLKSSLPESDAPFVTFHFTFEEALKLSLAIQACLLKLNTFDKRTNKGKGMGLSLAFKPGAKTVNVNTIKVGIPKESEEDSN
jgi:hypothetical protein